jgi:ubiquinone/menaquinone biosynthesis C-methylase UbiE
MSSNPVVDTYSRLATEYDSAENQMSCWGRLSRRLLGSVTVKDSYRDIVDVGCGTGMELARLAAGNSSSVQFTGVEPAPMMRELAAKRTAEYENVRILAGSFEELPLDDQSADYLYSILAFHWATDLERSVSELRRALRPTGEMDLMFIGRENGREFIRATTPIFFRYLSPAQMIRAASLRKQLTVEQTTKLFRAGFPPERLTVEESFRTYFDTLEGHWSWWVRIEGQFVEMPPEKREACDAAVRTAISTLATKRGIPYTVHVIHVRLR